MENELDLYRLGGYIDCLNDFALRDFEKIEHAFYYGRDTLNLDTKQLLKILVQELDIHIDDIIEILGLDSGDIDDLNDDSETSESESESDIPF